MEELDSQQKKNSLKNTQSQLSDTQVGEIKNWKVKDNNEAEDIMKKPYRQSKREIFTPPPPQNQNLEVEFTSKSLQIIISYRNK